MDGGDPPRPTATGTSQGIGLDPAAVTRWIDRLGIEHRGPLSFDRIGLGQSNLTFLVRDQDQGRWVLRRPPLGHLLASAHDVAREARILSALEDTAVPTPKVYGLTTDPEVTEVPLLLMEFVDGRVVDRMSVAEQLPPQRRRVIGVSLPRTLAAIHAVDLQATGLIDLASHKPYAQRQLKRWGGQWELSKTREVPKLDELTRRLTAAAPEQHELTLVHGDFHLRNVITARETGEVIAALDWELCTLGEPLADIGSLLAYWSEPGENTAGEFPRHGLGRLSRSRRGRPDLPRRDRPRPGRAEILACAGSVESCRHRRGSDAPSPRRTQERRGERHPDRRADRRTGHDGPQSRRRGRDLNYGPDEPWTPLTTWRRDR